MGIYFKAFEKGEIRSLILIQKNKLTSSNTYAGCLLHLLEDTKSKSEFEVVQP